METIKTRRIKMRTIKMRTIRTAAVASLFLTALTASAQQEPGTWSIIPRVGVNLSNLSDNTVLLDDNGGQLDSKFKAGMRAGAEVEYQLDRVLSLSAGVFYSMQGSRYSDYSYYEGKAADEPTTSKYTGYNNCKSDRQYLAVPITVNGYLARNFAVKVGVQFGYLLKASEHFETQSYTVDKQGQYTYDATDASDQTVTSNAQRFDVSIPIGLSYEYQNVVLDARYLLGVTGSNELIATKNRTFEFTVGYRFAL